jgi:Na+/proline symporter
MSLLPLLATSAVLIVATYLYYRNVTMDTETFLAAGRDTRTVVGGITILATWAGGAAILLPAQFGYAQGLPTALWFTIPNALTLVVFGVIAVRIRKRLPGGYTIAELFGDRSDYIYNVATLLTFTKSFVALSSEVVGGAAFLMFFSDLPQYQSVLLVLGTILAYSLISGLDASIFTDVLQTVGFAALYVVFVPWTIGAGEGFALVGDAIRDGALSKMFAGPNLEFAAILVVLLFTAPIVSQYMWQRAYAIEEDKLLDAFTLAGVGFFFVPAGMAVLGLIAAASGASLDQPVTASFVAMDQTIPANASLVVFLILLTTLLSAADSELVAIGSIVSVDVVGKIIDRDVNKTRVSRYAMVGTAVVVAAAAMGPFNTLDWVLLNAPIGAVLTIPILTYLYTPDVTSDTHTIAALLAGSVVAFPLYIYGTLQGDDTLRLVGLFGALAVTGLLACVVPAIQSRRAVEATG